MLDERERTESQSNMSCILVLRESFWPKIFAFRASEMFTILVCVCACASSHASLARQLE